MTTSNLEQIPTTTDFPEFLESHGEGSRPLFAPDEDVPPLLENVMAAICLDARRDSLRYALRSNVGHDGE